MIPRIIIRIENLLIALMSFWWLYSVLTAPGASFFVSFKSWYVIILVWLSFDLSMVGYLVNKKIGALLYNFVHSYIMVFLLVLAGFYRDPNFLLIGVILASHIGIDRFLGFGLRHPSNFKDSHIQRL